MVLWRSRKTISVMEPAEGDDVSQPSSVFSIQASQPTQYRVPPASPAGSVDPITAVRRANTPERNLLTQGDKKPREWRLKPPPNVQLSLKSRSIQDLFPAKPSRTGYVKSKRALTPGTHQQRNWSRGGKSTCTSRSLLQAGTQIGFHVREISQDPVRTRRGSITLPVSHTTTYENHPNLNTDARPKSGSSAYRRVHYQLPVGSHSSRSWAASRTGEATANSQELSAKSPSSRRCPSPQPSFASEYIAELFQTSDKFLISKPGSVKQRPASARLPARPKSTQPPPECSAKYVRVNKTRPASALPRTNSLKEYVTRSGNSVSTAKPHNPNMADNNIDQLQATPLRTESLASGFSGHKRSGEDVGASLSAKDDLGVSGACFGELERGGCSTRTDIVPQCQTSSPHQDQISSPPREYNCQESDDCKQRLLEDKTPMVDSSWSYYNPEESKQAGFTQEAESFLSHLNAQSKTLYTSKSLEHKTKGLKSDTRYRLTKRAESLERRTKANVENQGSSELNPDLDEKDDKTERTEQHDFKDSHQKQQGRGTARSAVSTRPRTAATRRDMEAHFQKEKQAVLDDLRGDLGRRLTLRKKSGIMSDTVFHKQIRSSFWTADMLYHRWGNDLLEMRQKWKSCTGDLSDQSDTSGDEEETRPAFFRGRRLAFSNQRADRDSPLDFEALRSVSVVNASQHHAQSADTPGGSTSAARRVSFEGRPVLCRAASTGILRSTPLVNSRRSSKVEVRPQAVVNLADVKVEQGLTSPADLKEDPQARRLRLRALFIATVNKVMRITRIAICMIRASKDLNVANFMAHLHFYNTRTMEEDLAFEKEKYSRKYSKVHVPNWARKIGLKSPLERTPDDIMALYSIMKNLKSFEKFSHQMRLEICRAATYSCCEKGRVILRQGHVGHNFYFIFSGSVFVQIDIEDSQTGVMTPSKTNVMEKGSSFGELALLGGGTDRRRASIICRETTELFAIEKEVFLDLCPDIFEKELKEKIAAVMNLDIFRQFPPGDLERLCFESFIEEAAYGSVIDLDTAHTDTIYFVLNGKVTLMKEFDLSMAYRDAAIQAYGDKSLPTPKPGQNSTDRGRQTLPQATDKNRCFMSVGELGRGDCTEIALLHASEKRSSPGVILVSNGVRLIQMSKRKLEQFAPREVLDQLRRQPVQPLRLPTDDDMYKKYLGDVNWAGFKSKVVDTLHQEQKGAPIASKPSTAKGSSGWARWPGSGDTDPSSSYWQISR